MTRRGHLLIIGAAAVLLLMAFVVSHSHAQFGWRTIAQTRTEQACRASCQAAHSGESFSEKDLNQCVLACNSQCARHEDDPAKLRQCVLLATNECQRFSPHVSQHCQNACRQFSPGNAYASCMNSCNTTCARYSNQPCKTYFCSQMTAEMSAQRNAMTEGFQASAKQHGAEPVSETQ